MSRETSLTAPAAPVDLGVDVAAWAAEGRISSEAWKGFARTGMVGASLPGGAGLAAFFDGLGDLAKTLDIGAVGAVCINEICLQVLGFFRGPASDHARELAMRGEARLCLCITESQSGADICGLETRIEVAERVTVTGRKIYISNAPVADYFIVVGRSRAEGCWNGLSMVLLPREAVGEENISLLPMSECRLMPLASVEFKDCLVDRDMLLGEKNRGFEYVTRALEFERLMIAMICVQISRAVMARCLDRLAHRANPKRDLSALQSVRTAVARHGMAVKVAGRMVEELIGDRERGDMEAADLLSAKIYASESMCNLVDFATQLGGGWGYLETSFTAHLHEKVRWLRIAGGPNEICLDILASEIFGG